MAEKDNPTIYQKLLKSKLFFIFLIPVALALVFGIFQNLYYRYQVKKDADKLNAEISNLGKQKEDLSKLLDYYNNPSNLEKEARLRLNYKKEGEKVVVILPSATSSGDTKISSPFFDGQDLPNYKQWWHYFFR